MNATNNMGFPIITNPTVDGVLGAWFHTFQKDEETGEIDTRSVQYQGQVIGREDAFLIVRLCDWITGGGNIFFTLKPLTEAREWHFYTSNWEMRRAFYLKTNKCDPGEPPEGLYPEDEEDYKGKPLSSRERFRIFSRDRYKCQLCGRTAADGDVVLEVDHKKPRSKGGTNRDENLWTLCFDCNRGKGAEML